MLKILILSDSHSSMHFMRRAIQVTRPTHVIHLGDYYDDGEVLAGENPHIRFHQVPGNCDRGYCDPTLPQLLCYDVGGVRLLMTHGHNHGVKSGHHRLVAQGHVMGAAAVLYGHTHEAVCIRDEEGMWIVNPGSCRGYGGSVALMETENNEIRSCRILGQEELEEMA